MVKIIEYRLGDQIYQVEITYKRGNRKIYYRFDGEKFKVTCPHLVTQNQIRNGLDKFGSGLIKKVAKHTSYIREDGVYILGEFVKFDHGFINVLGKQFLFVDETNFYKQARKIFKPILEKRLRYYENLMNVNPPYKFSMRFKKTNYGSNSVRENTISLNTIMIHFDYEIIDSVIVHELAHHFVRNHSKDFYDIVYKYCPNYDYLNKKLDRRIFND